MMKSGKVTGRLVVERHGGRATDHWRVVWRSERNGFDFWGDRAFQRAVSAMRQGGVRLRDLGTSEVLRESYAPRLRTKW